MIKTKKILQDDGDCSITVINGNYKVLVRIDDKNMQTMFAQKVTAALEYIDGILQEGEGIDMLSLPKSIYKHFTVSCEEDYNMSKDDVEMFRDFLDDGYKALHDSSGAHLTSDQMIVNIVTLSCFFSFRKEMLDMKEFPNVEFGLTQNREQETKILDSAQTITQILHKPIGQA